MGGATCIIVYPFLPPFSPPSFPSLLPLPPFIPISNLPSLSPLPTMYPLPSLPTTPFLQTHDNLEHLAMMEAILGPLPPRFARETRKSKYFWHGQLDWDPESPDGKYVKEHCRKLKVGLTQKTAVYEPKVSFTIFESVHYLYVPPPPPMLVVSSRPENENLCNPCSPCILINSQLFSYLHFPW